LIEFVVDAVKWGTVVWRTAVCHMAVWDTTVGHTAVGYAAVRHTAIRQFLPEAISWACGSVATPLIALVDVLVVLVVVVLAVLAVVAAVAVVLAAVGHNHLILLMCTSCLCEHWCARRRVNGCLTYRSMHAVV
jgi:hypothetical protein